MNATTTHARATRAITPNDLLALHGELVYYPLSHEHDLTQTINTSFDASEEADLHFIDAHSYDSQDGESTLNLVLEKDIASAMAS